MQRFSVTGHLRDAIENVTARPEIAITTCYSV